MRFMAEGVGRVTQFCFRPMDFNFFCGISVFQETDSCYILARIILIEAIVNRPIDVDPVIGSISIIF